VDQRVLTSYESPKAEVLRRIRMRFSIEAGCFCSQTRASAYVPRPRRAIVIATRAGSRVFFEDDFAWPDVSHELRVCELHACAGSARASCFYDITIGPRLLRSDDILEWDTTYFLTERPCPRCTLCERTCGRSGPHKLCSHGGTEHVWHFIGKKEGSIYVSVQGYRLRDGRAPLSHDLGGLAVTDFRAELEAIRVWTAEAKASIPSGFVL
jgi:hypothetical protein